VRRTTGARRRRHFAWQSLPSDIRRRLPRQRLASRLRRNQDTPAETMPAASASRFAGDSRRRFAAAPAARFASRAANALSGRGSQPVFALQSRLCSRRIAGRQRG